MLGYAQAWRLVRRMLWVERHDRLPGWVQSRVWRPLEQACHSAEEPALGMLWALTWPAPASRRGRMVVALARNPHDLSTETLGLAWNRWLEKPDDTLWEMLRGRAQPAGEEPAAKLSRLALGLAPPEEQCAAAIDLDLPEHLRAMLVERCVKQGLTPADPRRRVEFLLLTGQAEQYRAADPDGSLLTAAYQGASGTLRVRLRAAMVDAGDLDLVRVVAGGNQTRVAGMRPEERGYLAEQLTARGDWPALWRLLPQLPLVDAAAAVRSFRDGWRPGDDRGRELFARLSAMTPERLVAVLAELGPTRTVHLAPGGEIADCALSPDGTRLGAAITQVVNGPGESVVEYELPGGRLVARHEQTGTAQDSGGFQHLLHTGTAVIAALDRNLGHSPLIRYAEGGRQILADGEEWGGEVWALTHTRGGFAALTFDHHLLLGDADGRTGLRQVRLPDLIGHDRLWPEALAGEPDAGLLAVCGEELLVVDQDATRVIARSGPIPGSSPIPRDGTLKHVQFLGPDQLVTGSERSLTRWSIDGDALVQRATAGYLSVHGVTALPRHHRIVVQAAVPNNVSGAFRWKYAQPFLDATTLRETTPPVMVEDTRKLTTSVWSTPSGDHLAVLATTSTVEVRGRYPHPAVPLLERPPADFAPADLAAVTRAAASLPAGAGREALELLQACLEHRFASEVALGGQGRPDAGEHDIALG